MIVQHPPCPYSLSAVLAVAGELRIRERGEPASLLSGDAGVLLDALTEFFAGVWVRPDDERSKIGLQMPIYRVVMRKTKTFGECNYWLLSAWHQEIYKDLMPYGPISRDVLVAIRLFLDGDIVESNRLIESLARYDLKFSSHQIQTLAHALYPRFVPDPYDRDVLESWMVYYLLEHMSGKR